jgi:hypothetical protein
MSITLSVSAGATSVRRIGISLAISHNSDSGMPFEVLEKISQATATGRVAYAVFAGFSAPFRSPRGRARC